MKSNYSMYIVNTGRNEYLPPPLPDHVQLVRVVHETDQKDPQCPQYCQENLFLTKAPRSGPSVEGSSFILHGQTSI